MTDKITKRPYRKLVALDFDGVLHSYSSPWTNAATISDGPTPGAMQFLRDLVDDERFDVVVVSSRLSQSGGTNAVAQWLFDCLANEFGAEEGDRIHRQIDLAAKRPPAFVTIDDRGLTFVGEWPSLDKLAAFRPWNKLPDMWKPNPLTSVAAVNALMTRIGRVASEVGCPDGVQALDWIEELAEIGHKTVTMALDWIEELAEIGHKTVTMAPVTIERLSDEDLTRIRATPVRGTFVVSDEAGEQPSGGGEVELVRKRQAAFSDAAVKVEGRAEIDALIARTERARKLRSLLETAWDLGAATAYARRDRPADYEADGKSDETIRGLDVGRVIEMARKDDVAQARPTVDGLPVMSVDELPPPLDPDNARSSIDVLADQVALTQRTIDEFAGAGRFDVLDAIRSALAIRAKAAETGIPERAIRYAQQHRETEEVWTVGVPQPLSYVVTETGASSSWLDAAFAPYAAIEAIIRDAVPSGAPFTRAVAGGDLGWRIGAGWMSAEGTDPSKPDLVRACAQSLAAIPVPECLKPREADPDVVARTLAAGRAM